SYRPATGQNTSACVPPQRRQRCWRAGLSLLDDLKRSRRNQAAVGPICGLHWDLTKRALWCGTVIQRRHFGPVCERRWRSGPTGRKNASTSSRLSNVEDLAQATGGHHQVPVPSLARLRRWLWLVAFDLDTVLMLARL